jgi:1-acyl-sn-glycerol-3-phosphate acyltransferase
LTTAAMQSDSTGVVSPFLRLVRATGYTLDMCRRAVMASRRGGGRAAVRALAKQWAQGLSERMGIEIQVTGMEYFDPGRPCIVMANHQSYLDVLALYQAFPEPFGIVAKKELYRIPLFGNVMEELGCVKVDRGKHRDAVAALEAAAEEVRRGTSIMVFPEGTRSLGDRIGPMKKGPFHLAQSAGVPVLPVGIRGSAELMPRRNTGIRPGRIEVHVGEALAPPGPGTEARNALAARVRAELARLAERPAHD